MSESGQPANTVDRPSRLAELEKVIAQQTFRQRGSALAEICQYKLYIPEFTDFDEYCVARLGFQCKYGYRLIAASEVAEELSPIGDITKESHARKFVKVPKEKRPAVFQAALAVATLAGRRLSAKDIAEAANPPIAGAAPNLVSVQKKLRDLWGKASAAEKASFLGWVEMMDTAMERATSVELTEPPKSVEPTEEDQARFQCSSCGETFEDDEEAVAIYDCGECGPFTSDESTNNQCPNCNKFAAKVHACGCPSCNEGELEEIGGQS